jgi:hypothetical protein
VASHSTYFVFEDFMVKTGFEFALTGLSCCYVAGFLTTPENDLGLVSYEANLTKSFTGVIAAVLRGVSDTYVLRRSRVFASQICCKTKDGKEDTFAVLSFEAVMKYVLSPEN